MEKRLNLAIATIEKLIKKKAIDPIWIPFTDKRLEIIKGEKNDNQ